MTSPLLEVKKLAKRYPRAAGPEAQVLVDVSFSVEPGSIVALTGASGAGKSTLLRCICGLDMPDAGEIRFEGLSVSGLPRRRGAAPIQMICQDPGGSLNPRFTAFEVVEEPLRLRKVGNRAMRRSIVSRLLNQTGLPDASAGRKSWEFSGGQRARLAIARALASEPRLLLLDESLSGLDASIRGQIANLLLDLQRWRGLSYLLVTHDRDLAQTLTGDILELEHGRLRSSSVVTVANWRQEMAWTV